MVDNTSGGDGEGAKKVPNWSENWELTNNARGTFFFPRFFSSQFLFNFLLILCFMHLKEDKFSFYLFIYFLN